MKKRPTWRPKRGQPPLIGKEGVWVAVQVTLRQHQFGITVEQACDLLTDLMKPVDGFGGFVGYAKASKTLQNCFYEVKQAREESAEVREVCDRALADQIASLAQRPGAVVLPLLFKLDPGGQSMSSWTLDTHAKPSKKGGC